jgi:Leucine-rich repeat (LRR) protein
MPSCQICSYTACRGGTQCGVLRKLQEIKLNALATPYTWALNLSGLHLKSLPKDYFLGLERYECVDLSHNDLEALPFWTFEHLENLEVLNLQGNPRLVSIADALPGSLYSLDASNCPKLANDGWLFRRADYPELTRAYFSNCGFSVLPIIHWKAPRLVHLDFSKNAIRKMRPGALKKLHGLSWLDLSNNRLKTFDPSWLSPQAWLHTLKLSNNRITRLSKASLAPFANTLQSIYLDSNHVRDVDAHLFEDCHSLSIVGLSNNKLKTLPASLFAAHPDIYVSLCHNAHLSYIDPSCFLRMPDSNLEVCLAGCTRLALAPPPVPTDEDDGVHVDFLTTLLEAQDDVDRVLAKSRFDAFHEELMMTVFHPSRIEKLVAEHGLEIMEMF